MFGVCHSRCSQSSMFLFPLQQRSICTSADTLTSSAPPDCDVIPEVDTPSMPCGRQKLDSSVDAKIDQDDCSCSDVDVTTSRPNSVGDDDADDDAEDKRQDDVSVTSSAATSPSNELKFGIDRILIKHDDVKKTSSIGIARVTCLLSVIFISPKKVV